MSAPTEIIKLVEAFNENEQVYKSGRFNETQVRQEFINPFFKALGWDVDNEQKYSEAYKDVVHEDAIKVGISTKAPDYSFRIGGQRKFFLEAKKPSVNIKEDIHPAYQLRRYAWSAKLPLSILTDFEEFAVYDCRIKPNKNDKASVARIMYYNYKDYIEKWDEIYSIFSKEAILKGSFDKFVQTNKNKKGTAEVDDSFLTEMESWRDLLAKNIALRNKDLSNRALNEAVQKTIDRIIFLRICEDRGIENYGQLQALVNQQNIYQKLCAIFIKADTKYNSGLFHFKSEADRKDFDNWTLNLIIDDKILKDILKRLYYPDCPYEFSVLPADILGHVYEKFLGKVIRLTPSHQAKVEEKPEVRKAGGVYYTPTYIVNYIVENTVGRLLNGEDGKTPIKIEEADKLKICDPACGSGSFLLGAYQYLLNWYLEQYKMKPEKFTKGKYPKIYQSSFGDYKLTTSEKKRILLNNIYGVDIDSQAVEVTKLSLLLKVLEDETEETLQTTISMFQERALPDLGNNIKCGNSLIGTDFYEGKDVSMFDENDIYKINAFDWDKEFPEVFEKKKIQKKLKPFHITWATFNSRVNQRMIDYEPVIEKSRASKGFDPKIPPRILSDEEEVLIAKEIQNIKNKYQFRIFQMNICKDHIHLGIVCSEDEVSSIVRTIKSITAIKLHKYIQQNSPENYRMQGGLHNNNWKQGGLPPCNNNEKENLPDNNTMQDDWPNNNWKQGGLPPCNNNEKENLTDNNTMQGDPPPCNQPQQKTLHPFKDNTGASSGASVNYENNIYNKLWQSKFSSSLIRSEEEFTKVYQYIENNRLKHELDENPELKKIILSILTPINELYEPFTEPGGFDAVIGNPPYVDYRILDEIQVKYIISNFESTKINEKWNLYIPFIELGIKILNSSGLFGFIIPNAFLVSKFGIKLRLLLLNLTSIYKLVDVSRLNVFGKVSTYPILLFFKNQIKNDNYIFIKYPHKIRELYNNKYDEILQPSLNSKENDFIISSSFSEKNIKFIEKIYRNCMFLENLYGTFIWGTSISGFKRYKINYNEYIALDETSKKIYKKVIQTADIKRYIIDWKGEYIDSRIYSKKCIENFNKEKIVIARVTKSLQATLDNDNYYLGKSSLITEPKINLFYLLGILNSKLINYIYFIKFENTHMSGGYLRFDIPYLKQLPIKVCDLKNIHEKNQHDKMVELVDQMLDLNKRLHSEGISSQEKKLLEQQISITDRQIDYLVYELYGLTEEEIKIVEGNEE